MFSGRWNGFLAHKNGFDIFGGFDRILTWWGATMKSIVVFYGQKSSSYVRELAVFISKKKFKIYLQCEFIYVENFRSKHSHLWNNLHLFDSLFLFVSFSLSVLVFFLSLKYLAIHIMVVVTGTYYNVYTDTFVHNRRAWLFIDNILCQSGTTWTNVIDD